MEKVLQAYDYFVKVIPLFKTAGLIRLNIIGLNFQHRVRFLKNRGIGNVSKI